MEKRLVDDFSAEFPNYTASELKKIEMAIYLDLECSAKNNSVSLIQDSQLQRSLRVAKILARNGMDSDTICASFIFPVIQSTTTMPALPDEKIVDLDEAIHLAREVSHITTTHQKNTSRHEADSIRKMLFAMVDDVRVILIRIADRLDAIRNANDLPENERRTLAAEVLDIWAPLSDRLGMQEEKNELEDLSLKYSNPDVYQQIKKIVAQKKDERKNYLDSAVEKIKDAAVAAGIEISIKSRAKHFYSIYQKMRKRNVEAQDIYDLLAIRVICQTNAECYTLIGIVHGLWKPIDGKFKDYIAMPKANGYQSLHTTVMCEEHRLEIQIRTEEMHEKAEHGVASHWLYKKGKSHDTIDASNLELFNKIRNLRDGNITDENFFSSLKTDLLGDEIYVFTPKGNVIELPVGATAIDFAYKIHSAIGEKIVGAKADGKIIPLNEPLKNTQIIEILTNPQAHPTVSQLEHVKTAKAKQKIRAWLAANGVTERVTKTPEEIEAQKEAARLMQENASLQRAHKHVSGEPEKSRGVTKIRIGNTTNFLITFAQCCHPKTGDKIAGYISRTRGITIHRADCWTYLRNPNKDSRSVEVEWDTEK